MRYRGYRIDIILALALLTVIILAAGQIAYGRVCIERPLLEDLCTIPGIKEATLEKAAEGYIVKLNLSHVSSLPFVYRQAKDIAQTSLYPSNFTLKIIDNRNQLLDDLYWQMQIYIEEAIVQGNFSVAAEKLNELANFAEVNAKFHVDEECVYLELYQDQAYLYAVRHRIPPQKGAAKE